MSKLKIKYCDKCGKTMRKEYRKVYEHFPGSRRRLIASDRRWCCECGNETDWKESNKIPRGLLELYNMKRNLMSLLVETGAKLMEI